MPKTSEYSGEDRLSASPAEHFYIKYVELFIHAPALLIENTLWCTQYLELHSLQGLIEFFSVLDGSLKHKER